MEVQTIRLIHTGTSKQILPLIKHHSLVTLCLPLIFHVTKTHLEKNSGVQIRLKQTGTSKQIPLIKH